MRMHKFKNQNADVWINLDAVAIVQPRGITRTIITTNGWVQEVDGFVEDVLALISPPAAPDTYEEELVAKKRAQIDIDARIAGAKAHQAIIEADKAARLDEFKILEQRICERMGFVPGELGAILDWRRRAIRKGEPTAVPMEG